MRSSLSSQPKDSLSGAPVRKMQRLDAAISNIDVRSHRAQTIESKISKSFVGCLVGALSNSTDDQAAIMLNGHQKQARSPILFGRNRQ